MYPSTLPRTLSLHQSPRDRAAVFSVGGMSMLMPSRELRGVVCSTVEKIKNGEVNGKRLLQLQSLSRISHNQDKNHAPHEVKI